MEADVTQQGSGTLFVVSTPIGNMGDFSFRAVETLRSVAAVLAEDTRHTRHLLDRYEIDDAARRLSRAQRGEVDARARRAAAERREPGARSPTRARPCSPIPARASCARRSRRGCSVSPVPGASALLAALVASGLEADRFTFFGFLARERAGAPHGDRGARRAPSRGSTVRGAVARGRHAGRARRGRSRCPERPSWRAS